MNVFLEMAAVMALATSNPIDELITTAPYSLSDKILPRHNQRNIALLTAYQVVAILLLILFAGPLLGLPYEWSTPPYNLTTNEPTNKTTVFSMVVQTYVLMQCVSISILKLHDEAHLSWFERFNRHKEFTYALVFILVAQYTVLELGIYHMKLCGLTTG